MLDVVGSCYYIRLYKLGVKGADVSNILHSNVGGIDSLKMFSKNVLFLHILSINKLRSVLFVVDKIFQTFNSLDQF